MPGQYYDAESGLHYNWNRYYNPSIGRYISSDPIGLDGGINTFLYANANPVVYFDEDGLESEHEAGKRQSTKEKHEKGRTRNKRDKGGEKGDKRRPYGPSGNSDKEQNKERKQKGQKYPPLNPRPTGSPGIWFPPILPGNTCILFPEFCGNPDLAFRGSDNIFPVTNKECK